MPSAWVNRTEAVVAELGEIDDGMLAFG